MVSSWNCMFFDQTARLTKVHNISIRLSSKYATGRSTILIEKVAVSNWLANFWILYFGEGYMPRTSSSSSISGFLRFYVKGQSSEAPPHLLIASTRRLLFHDISWRLSSSSRIVRSVARYRKTNELITVAAIAGKTFVVHQWLKTYQSISER